MKKQMMKKEKEISMLELNEKLARKELDFDMEAMKVFNMKMDAWRKSPTKVGERVTVGGHHELWNTQEVYVKNITPQGWIELEKKEEVIDEDGKVVSMTMVDYHVDKVGKTRIYDESLPELNIVDTRNKYTDDYRKYRSITDQDRERKRRRDVQG